MSVPERSTRRPVAVAMLYLAVVLLGGISFVRLPIDLLPEVSYPRLVVHTSYPDVAPAEVERLVSEPIEEMTAAVPGVERVTSSSREGVSLVTLRFAWGTDMDFAMLGVRERLDNLRGSLPESATRPRILRVDPESEPVMSLSVAGAGDLWTTRDLAETVFKRRLEQLDGVAEAAVTGGLQREIHVEVDPELLEAYDLTVADVSQALERANVSAPGGEILRGRYRYALRTLGEFREVEEIGRVVVGRQRQEGGAAGASGRREEERGREVGFRLVRLRDVARIVDGFEEREAIARFDGREAVGLLVFKESGANTVAVAREVEETLGLLREQYPEVSVDVASSQAGFISASISNVVQALVYGGILAFLVLFLFLRDARYPVAIALAIPISVVATFALMEASGVSLNIMSLGGLALGVGMLVDNSIVVLENIFRHREEGADVGVAAAVGAEEVQGAITASTLTTISVFGPIVYVEGVAGELFGDLSLAVAFSLLASLAVALTLLPTLAARWGSPPDDGPGEVGEPAADDPVEGLIRTALRLPGRLLRGLQRFMRALAAFWWEGISALLGRIFGPLIDAFDRGFRRFADRYHRLLEAALRRRRRVIAASAAALVLTAAAGLALDRDLLPDVDQGAFTVRLEMPEGTTLPATARAAGTLEATLLDDPAIEAVFSRIGRDVRALATGEGATGLNTARLDVRVRRGAATADVLERVRPAGERVDGATVSFETGGATVLGRMVEGTDADIAVRVRGEDLDAAFAYAEDVRSRLRSLPELGNVRVGAERGQPQVHVSIDRERAAALGLEAREIAETIETYMRGRAATEFVDFDRKIDVVVRLPDERRRSLESLRELRVGGVPLREVVTSRTGMGPSEIRREDQGRVVLVHADVVSGGLDEAIGAIEGELAGSPPPPGLRVEVGGENEEMRRSFRDLAFAFGLALLLVYMILAAQFESFVQPVVILVSVPLALVGAVAALVVAGEGLNTMSLIGVVILVGIVVNDAIVKVDFINQMRARGMPVREAILEAGMVRLRPIVMTTVTTVLGLTPMALGIGRGADLRAPLAIAVIGGLLVATALTLIVVPVVYDLVDSARERVRGLVAAEGRGAVPATGSTAILLLVALPATVGLAACGGDDAPGRAGPTVRDSAGIAIVENPDPGSADVPEWTVGPEPSLEIGTLDGAEEYQLYRIRGVRRLSDGRIVVANAGTHELRLYDVEGDFLRAAGSEGDGPGEFQNLMDVFVVGGDTILAYDWRGQRISVFTGEGDFVRSFRLTESEDIRAGVSWPEGVFDDGSILVRKSPVFFSGSGVNGVQDRPQTFLRMDRSAGVIDSVGSFPGTQSFAESGENFIRVRTLPFGRRPTWAVDGAGFWFGAGKRYEIARYSPAGELLRLVRADRDPPRVTGEAVERYREGELADADEADRPGLRRTLAKIPYPEAMPTFSDLHVDARGHLWVEDYGPPGAAERGMTVFDGEGRIVARARIPAGFSPMQIGDDFVAGRYVDELEVERVRVYPLTRTEAAR